MSKFQAGKTYQVPTAVEPIRATIIRRSAKTVWFKQGSKEYRRPITTINDGIETFRPIAERPWMIIRADALVGIPAPALTKFVKIVDGMTVDAEQAKRVADMIARSSPVLNGSAIERNLASNLRPYQQEMLSYVKHRHELVEQPRETEAAVEALKQSSEQVSREARFNQSTAIIARFCQQAGKPVSRENIKFVLDLISSMTAEDFDDLDLMREWLRGE